MSRLPVLAVALLLVLAGCATQVPTAADRQGADRTEAGPASPGDFEDPATDVLGWENGYWYDEPLAVTPADGLNASERAAVVNRTAARVERLRGLELRRPVPVAVISRERFRQRGGNRSVSPALRRFDNAKFEALFMVNESTDSVAVQRANAGSAVGGFYLPGQDRIVLIGGTVGEDGSGAAGDGGDGSDGDDAAGDGRSVRLSELTLAHELVHALQDQRFRTRYDRPTRDRRNALNGLIEGDARYVERLYEERCGDEWDCLPQGGDGGGRGGGGGGGGLGLANIGPYLLTFHPYSDGPVFVRALYEQGGWGRVNDAYRAPPVGTEQVIHPERYPEDRPYRPPVRDRTRGSWDRIPVQNRPDHAEIGEAGLNAMLVYPAYESRGRAGVIPVSRFVNRENGAVSRLDPLNYDHPYTDGVRGDRLVPYLNDADETGYVWRLAFDDAAEAREFLEGYGRLLEYRNATAVREVEGGTAYRIPEDDPNGFGDAFRVTRDGAVVTIVNAPTVAELDRVRARG